MGHVDVVWHGLVLAIIVAGASFRLGWALGVKVIYIYNSLVTLLPYEIYKHLTLD